jgi:hypothetical protein
VNNAAVGLEFAVPTPGRARRNEARSVVVPALSMCCPLCDAIVPVEELRILDHGVSARCSDCSGVVFARSPALGAPGPERGREDRLRDTIECPKCGTVQPETSHCRQCGLRQALFASYRPPAVSGSAEIELLWAACERNWTSQEHHRRFADAVAHLDAYPYALRCYRSRLRNAPGDPVTRRQLERLASMVQTRLLVTQRPARDLPAEPMPYRNVAALLCVLILALAAGTGFALLHTTGRGHRGEAAATSSAVPPAVTHAGTGQPAPAALLPSAAIPGH